MGNRFLLLATLVAAAPAGAEDLWWGEDKALHFGVSALGPTGGYAAGTALLDDPEAGLLLGAALGLGAGVGKELYDLTGRGDPSFRDLAWDAAGVATGMALTWAVDRLFLADAREQRRQAAQRRQQELDQRTVDTFLRALDRQLEDQR